MMTWRELMVSGCRLPDYTELPCEDGKWAKSSLEAPQRAILTDALTGWLLYLRPTKMRFFISGDSGIYWRLPEPPEPLVNGAIDPDWYFFPWKVQQDKGRWKGSYVMWHERILPWVVLEFVLPEDVEARDRTPGTGKFWIYEQGLGVPYYGIYGMEEGCVEVFRLVDGKYEAMPANSRGHYEIAPLEAELGIWHGRYWDLDHPWLRWWDGDGRLLPTAEEWREQRRRTGAAN